MTETAPSTASTPVVAATDHGVRNRLVINLLLVSTFVVILNETIMNVALPTIIEDLNITPQAGQWLTTAFLLTMSIVIPITGFLLQRYSTRAVFLAAMSLFSTGTLIAALAPGFEVLLFARVVQASGTAIMLPLLMTTVMTLVPASGRGRTMGNISIVIAVAPALGPTIAGLILSVLDWRWIFWIVLPIALASLVLGYFRVPNVSEPRKVPLDILSVILSAFAFGGIVYGLSDLTELHAKIALGVGVVMLGLFILRQLHLQRQDRALLDLRTFLSKNFSFSMVLMALSMMTLFGTLILLPMYLQYVLALTALQIGLLLLPGGLVMGLLGPVVGRLYDRFGAPRLLIPGTILVSAVLWGLTLVGQTTPFYLLMIAHILLSVGLAFVFTPLFTAALSSVRPSLYSYGSATLGTIQQVAGAAGTAIFITVMASHSATLLASGSSEIAATTGGIKAAFLYGAIISVLGVVTAFFVRTPAADPDAPAMHGGH